jgi:hypothetical protein
VKELKDKGGPAAKKPKPPEKKALPKELDMAEQHTVKQFMPGFSKVWKSRGTGDWKAQVEGWPSEISRRCCKYGEDRAIRLVVSEAWYQHGLLRGQDYADAAISNLLALDELLS